MKSDSRATDQDVVLYTTEGHVATVTFNRPEVLNACNMAVLLRLVSIFDDINDRPDVWCVVLKGNGRAFCVGADQKERATMSLDDIRRRRKLAPRAFGAMRNCDVPVIAQVHGFALGGGLEMALGCDLIAIADDAVLGMVETLRGSMPAGGGTQLLPRLIGPLRAKELIFTGRKFTGQEARELGLANLVTPADQLDQAVSGLVSEILKAAPISNAQAKRAINLSLDTDVANGITAEAALYERTLTTKDRAHALESYQAGRTPTFRGE